MGDYLIWILVALLLIVSLYVFIRDLSNLKRATCPSCNSTNVSVNNFRKYGVCNDCHHKWELPKTGSMGVGGDGGGF